MPPRYFTAEQANEALREVRPLTQELVEHRRALLELQELQTSLNQRIAGNGGNVEPRELQQLAGRDEVRRVDRVPASPEPARE